MAPPDEDGELILWGAARSAAADDHQGKRAVLSLANEDEVPAGHARRLGREVGACAHVEEAVELRLSHGALAARPAARPAAATPVTADETWSDGTAAFKA